MDLACAACNTTLSVSSDQVGGAVRCPACAAVMQVQPLGAVTDAMVTCPGCASKLAIPDTTATTYRCPKCAQHLAVPGAVVTAEASPVDVWADAGATFAAGDSSGFGAAAPGPAGNDLGGFGTAPPPSTRPNTRSSTAWGSQASYSDHVASVGPGLFLLLLSGLGVLINLAYLFFAMGITDTELLADDAVAWLKTFVMARSVMAALYLTLIALGAIQMILRQHRWAGVVVCVMAMLPVIPLAYGNICLGVLAYPLFFGAGVWGLVVLVGGQR